MSAQKIRRRITPLPAGGAVVLTLTSFSFITAGAFMAYPPIRDMMANRDPSPGWPYCIAASLFPFVIGWLTLRASRQIIGDRIAFEDASVITNARILDRGRAQRTDEYGRTFYTYWVEIQFRPTEARAPVSDLVLRAFVRKRLHDTLEPGQSLKVRYGISNPRFALLEGETRNLERALDFNGLLLHWTLANALGGVVGILVGSFFGSLFGGNDPLLIGLIVGLVKGEAQWTVLLRYIPLHNWMWVAASMIGWGLFADLDGIAYGLVGGIILGFMQWLILRRKADGAEWWGVLTVLGAIAGQIAYNILAPSTHYLIAAGIFEIAYGIPAGIALYMIARRYQERVPAERPFRLPPSDIRPLVGVETHDVLFPGVGAKEMRLVLNGKTISKNADESIVNQALRDLANEGDGFAILSRTKDTYIQVLVEHGEDFKLEYQDGSLNEHYDCVSRDLDLTQVLRAFGMFLKSDARLVSEFSWELMDL